MKHQEMNSSASPSIYVVGDDSVLKFAETWSFIKAHCVLGRIINVM